MRREGLKRHLLCGSGAVASGLLLAVSFPPVAAAETAWMALIPLLLVARFCSRPSDAFRWGFFSGFIFWLLSLFWLLRLSVTGGPWPLVIVGWLLLSAYCAVYTGGFLMLTAAMWKGRSAEGSASLPGNIGLMVATPLAWVGFEYLRANLFTGFLWNPLGVSQFRNLAVIQWAEWGGVYAVSALIVFMNMALALTVVRLLPAWRGGRTARFHVELMIGLLVCALCWMVGARRAAFWRQAAWMQGAEVRVTAVQPNVPQLKKWPPDMAQEIYTGLRELTELAALGRPDLMVWPETALPAPLNTDREAMEFVEAMVAKSSPLLVGAMEVEGQTPATRLYNSAFLVEANGGIQSVYRKRHLVPFGEYLPLSGILPWIASLAPLGFTCSPGEACTIFRLKHPETTFSVLICFEDTIPGLARDGIRQGAAFLVNQTNDAWFDGSAAALQHLSHGVFRCVENRAECVRAANTGITCFIDRTGRIDDEAILEAENWGMGTSRFASSRVWARPPDARLTFYTRLGDLPFALPCGVLSAAFFVIVTVREKRQNRELWKRTDEGPNPVTRSST